MTTIPLRDQHTRRPCPSCPSLLEVIEAVLVQIERETKAPASLTDLDASSREFLVALHARLSQALEAA